MTNNFVYKVDVVSITTSRKTHLFEDNSSTEIYAKKNSTLLVYSILSNNFSYFKVRTIMELCLKNAGAMSWNAGWPPESVQYIHRTLKLPSTSVSSGRMESSPQQIEELFMLVLAVSAESLRPKKFFMHCIVFFSFGLLVPDVVSVTNSVVC